MKLIKFVCFLILGTGLLLAGIAVPVYLRGIAAPVIEHAGRQGESAEQQIEFWIQTARPAPAALMRQALSGSADRPEIDWGGLPTSTRVSGGTSPVFENFIRTLYLPDDIQPAQPVNQLLTRRSQRSLLLSFLQESPNPTVHALLDGRKVSGFLQLLPVQTPGGAALDSAALLAGMASLTGSWSRPMERQLVNLVQNARDKDLTAISQLENVYTALLSLGQRFAWSEMEILLPTVGSPHELSQLAQWFRQHPDKTPLIFSSVALFPELGSQIAYYQEFGKEGFGSIQKALPSGTLGLRELFNQRKPVYDTPAWLATPELEFLSPFIDLHLGLAASDSRLAKVLKFLYLMLGGAFLCSALLTFTKSSSLQKTLTLRGVRNMSFGLVVAVIGWMLLEPALVERSTPPGPGLSINFADLSPISFTTQATMPNFPIDQITLLILLTFFLVQVVIYTFCLIKLSEIRRRREPSAVKIRLLENEEVLFDAGLYVGLGGTVSALIFIALNIVEASLMAAYASTLFGIIFVALLKIFHVRPYRQSLILEKRAPQSIDD